VQPQKDTTISRHSETKPTSDLIITRHFLVHIRHTRTAFREIS